MLAKHEMKFAIATGTDVPTGAGERLAKSRRWETTMLAGTEYVASRRHEV